MRVPTFDELERFFLRLILLLMLLIGGLKILKEEVSDLFHPTREVSTLRNSGSRGDSMRPKLSAPKSGI